MTTTTQNDAVPAANQIDDNESIPEEVTGLGGSGRHFYNIKEGKFISTDKEGNILDSIDKIVGRLERFGLEEGTYRTGRQYYQLEIDLKTNKGPVTVRLDLLNPDLIVKPSVAALQLARALIHARFEPKALMALQSYQMEPPADKKHRRPSNNISVYRVSIDGKSDKITAPRVEGEDWEDYEKALPHLPAFSARPKRSSGPTHLDGLNADLKERGWPTPEENPKGWLTLLSSQGVAVSTIEEIVDDVWGSIRLELQGAPRDMAVPPALAPVVAVKTSGMFGGAKPAVNPVESEYDALADE